MAPFALLFGALLVAVGVIGYSAPGAFGEYDKVSMTSLIPAFVGAALILCGLIVMAKPALRKHLMHAAALIGILGFLGGFMPLQRSGFNFSKASAVSGALMSGLSLVFVVLCVKSFIDARKARTASLASGGPSR
jgi:drug/metabolite transporter (DMT)-like permease